MELNGIYVAAAIGFILPTLYLLKQVGITEKLPKIKDDNNILTLSILVIACPFIFSTTYNYVQKNDFLASGEGLKYTIPLITFLLGQFLEKRNKEKVTQRLTEKLAKKVDFELEEISIRLRKVSWEALEFKRTRNFAPLGTKSFNLSKYLNEVYDFLKREENINDFQYGQEILIYIDDLKNELSYLSSLPTESPETIFEWLERIHFFYIDGFRIRLIISKNILTDDKRVNLLISIIKRYQTSLERRRDRIKKKKARIAKSLEKGISIREYEEVIDINYDVDIEANALRQIQELLREFDEDAD